MVLFDVLFFESSSNASFEATQDERAFFEHRNTSNTREVVIQSTDVADVC